MKVVFTAKIIKIGDSNGIIIPKKYLQLLGVKKGDYIIVELRKD